MDDDSVALHTVVDSDDPDVCSAEASGLSPADSSIEEGTLIDQDIGLTTETVPPPEIVQAEDNDFDVSNATAIDVLDVGDADALIAPLPEVIQPTGVSEAGVGISEYSSYPLEISNAHMDDDSVALHTVVDSDDPDVCSESASGLSPADSSIEEGTHIDQDIGLTTETVPPPEIVQAEDSDFDAGDATAIDVLDVGDADALITRLPDVILSTGVSEAGLGISAYSS